MNPLFYRLRAIKIHIPMKKFLYFASIILCLLSCEDKAQVPSKIEAIDIDFELKRFDLALANASPDELSKLKKEYPYFFTKRFDDSYWQSRMRDTLQKEIEREVAKVFSYLDDTSQDLELLFKHISYYFPEAHIPKTITVATDVDYRNKVILNDSLLFVSLSTYLGADHYFYDRIARFHADDFRKEQITVDVAHAFAKAKTPPPRSSQFIDYLIYEGKKIYLMEQLLSLTSTNELLSYTPQELAFAQENEINIWEYFVKKELLFDTDKKLLSRFIDPAPFSKFYLDFDNETPGRIGRYIGYRIVSSYMAKNDIPLKAMLLRDAETIFNTAKYKP